MSEGAKTIHKANPQVLVVVSGLNYDTEFHFLKRKHLKLNIGKKLVYETHLYSWSGVGILNLKETWTMQPLNKICANSLEALDNQVGFLRSGSDAAPLIFSEFGFDESGSNEEDNNFLTCLQTYLVGNDLDWGLWAFQGSYYLRDDKAQVDENFGLMDSSWTHLRYPNFNEKFQLLIRKIQGSTFHTSHVLLPTQNEGQEYKDIFICFKTMQESKPCPKVWSNCRFNSLFLHSSFLKRSVF
ncbi:glycosyl hydrolase 5 family protein-like isoform X3 [Arachis stenosperma]|uniref:glycosyl hydrolase 5 family protein-like isoform X3 n=1 Tax=Arachis stenosperma TaxID=217475 RepID=UPI0025AD2044|nr:glycosyl hydrolase 5 family protein-like isoform X3 [Arachis stenosperma]